MYKLVTWIHSWEWGGWGVETAEFKFQTGYGFNNFMPTNLIPDRILRSDHQAWVFGVRLTTS